MLHLCFLPRLLLLYGEGGWGGVGEEVDLVVAVAHGEGAEHILQIGELLGSGGRLLLLGRDQVE